MSTSQVTNASGGRSTSEKAAPQQLKSSWIGIGLLLLLVTSLYFSGVPIYETNDDVGLSMIASGSAFLDVPEPHILYSHIWVGHLLSALYKTIPSFPWYGFYLAASQLLALSLLAISVCEGRTSKWALFVCALMFTAALRVVTVMQFTTIASFVGTAAGIVLLDWLFKSSSRKTNWQLAGSLLLFALSSLIRAESCQLTLLLTFTALLTSSIAVHGWSQFRKGILTLGAAGLMVITLHWANQQAYSGPGWSTFYKVNELRMHLVDYKRSTQRTATTAAAFKAIGWQQSDADIFNLGYVIEPTRFNLEKLEQLNQMLPRVMATFKQLKADLKSLSTDSAIVPPICILLSVIPIFLFTRRLVAPALFALAAGALIVGLTLACKCPARIYMSILTFTAFYNIWLLEPFKLRRGIQSSARLTSLVAILILLVAATAVNETAQLKQVRKVSRDNETLRTFLDKLPTDRLYVVWGADIPYEDIRPFDDVKGYFKQLKFLSVSSHGRSSLVQSRLQQFDIQGDLLSQLDHPSVLLIANRWVRPAIESYVQQNYNKAPVFNLLLEEPKIGVQVFKVTMRPLPAPGVLGL